jgi:uncharacterized protein
MAPRTIFINLPVDSPARSRAFYEALGFEVDETFSDETATCVIISEAASIMFLEHAKFAQFTTKAVADNATHVMSLTTISADSREEVDALVAAAIANGGRTEEEPTDYGFMYTHSFVDPDGHGWGVGHMSAVPA